MSSPSAWTARSSSRTPTRAVAGPGMIGFGIYDQATKVGRLNNFGGGEIVVPDLSGGRRRMLLGVG